MHNRKNWLFAGSLRAGQRAAVIMSLIQSAKLNGHDPHHYLKDVLERLPTQPQNRLRSCCRIVGSSSNIELQVMATLSEIVGNLRRWDQEPDGPQRPTIYAQTLWSAQSQAIVCWSMPKGGLPDDAARLQLVRLVEVV
jgi:transposase